MAGGAQIEREGKQSEGGDAVKTKITIERNQRDGAGEDYDIIWATKNGRLCPLCLKQKDNSPAARWLRGLLDEESTDGSR